MEVQAGIPAGRCAGGGLIWGWNREKFRLNHRIWLFSRNFSRGASGVERAGHAGVPTKWQISLD